MRFLLGLLFGSCQETVLSIALMVHNLFKGELKEATDEHLDLQL
jgi:hypothetical protein